MTRDEINAAVKDALVGALGVGEEEINPKATLLGDLGAESIDLLDILFAWSARWASRSRPRTWLPTFKAGSRTRSSVTRQADHGQGLAQLKKVMPQIDTAALSGKLEAEKVLSLFTVDNLVDMVGQRAAAKSA